MQAHPQLDMIHELVQIFGWPVLIGGLWWVARTWTQSTLELKSLHDNTKLAVERITTVQTEVNAIKDNHLAHLQEGITSVAETNKEAVGVLREIKSGIDLLKDRFPRA